MHKRWEMDDDNDLQIMKQLCKGKTILCRSCGAGFYKASETNEFKCTKCGSVFEVTPDSTVK